MSHIPPSPEVVVVPEDQAKLADGVPVTGRLQAGSSATGGALSCQRIMLAGGASGINFTPFIKEAERREKASNIQAGSA